MPTKSNNTGGRGGKRPGAGRKPKSNLEKAQSGNRRSQTNDAGYPRCGRYPDAETK